MAIFSGRTIVTCLSLFHVTLGFFFLTNPSIIEDQGLVWIIGESMGMVRVPPLSFFLLPVGISRACQLLHPSSPS